MNKVSSISIVIPAFNEERLIEATVRTIQAGLERFAIPYELIIIDDGSTDTTGDIMRKLAAQDRRIKVFSHPSNIGKGSALANGFGQAQMEWILFTDADMQIGISHLGAFLSHADKHDVLIGYRVVRTDPFIRRLLSKVYRQLASSLLGLRMRDAHCPFKLIRRDVIRGRRWATQGFLIDSELLCMVTQAGYAVQELPVTPCKSPRTRSSLQLRHVGMIIREFISLLRDVRRTR
jgi:glycosyltransferase involved in cell wall biosynthesis